MEFTKRYANGGKLEYIFKNYFQLHYNTHLMWERVTWKASLMQSVAQFAKLVKIIALAVSFVEITFISFPETVKKWSVKGLFPIDRLQVRDTLQSKGSDLTLEKARIIQ